MALGSRGSSGRADGLILAADLGQEKRPMSPDGRPGWGGPAGAGCRDGL